MWVEAMVATKQSISRIAKVGLVAAVLLLLSNGNPAIAQDAAPTTASQTTNQLTNDAVGGEQVSQLVRSLLAIQPLLEEANDRMLAAEGEEEQWEIEQAFIQDASTIVEAQGLTVEQYRQLMALANNDPAFRDRVARKLDEMEREAGSEGAVVIVPSPTPSCCLNSNTYLHAFPSCGIDDTVVF